MIPLDQHKMLTALGHDKGLNDFNLKENMRIERGQRKFVNLPEWFFTALVLRCKAGNSPYFDLHASVELFASHIPYTLVGDSLCSVLLQLLVRCKAKQWKVLNTWFMLAHRGVGTPTVILVLLTLTVTNLTEHISKTRRTSCSAIALPYL